MIKAMPILSLRTTTASAFIVPNTPCKFGEFISNTKDDVIHMANLCWLNNLGPRDLNEEIMIQMWFTDKEGLESENLDDHGFTFEYNGTTVFSRPNLTYLPYSLLKDQKEGDVLHLRVPGYGYTQDDNHERVNYILDMEVTLSQTAFRYRGHGNFETCLENLISYCNIESGGVRQ